MSAQEKLCVETAATANATFLGNLERWLEAIIECNLEKDASIEEVAEVATSKYKQAIKANIEYHTIAASLYRSPPEDRNSPFYHRHELLAKIYKSILEGQK
jgi:hypothetical protein